MIERDWRGREREKERKRETVGHPSSLIGRLHWEFVIQIETRILPDIKQLQIKSIIASVDKRERARGRGRERGERGSCSAAFEANESTCFAVAADCRLPAFSHCCYQERMKSIAIASARARSRTSLDSALLVAL